MQLLNYVRWCTLEGYRLCCGAGERRRHRIWEGGRAQCADQPHLLAPEVSEKGVWVPLRAVRCSITVTVAINRLAPSLPSLVPDICSCMF